MNLNLKEDHLKKNLHNPVNISYNKMENPSNGPAAKLPTLL